MKYHKSSLYDYIPNLLIALFEEKTKWYLVIMFLTQSYCMTSEDLEYNEWDIQTHFITVMMFVCFLLFLRQQKFWLMKKQY